MMINQTLEFYYKINKPNTILANNDQFVNKLHDFDSKSKKMKFPIFANFSFKP